MRTLAALLLCATVLVAADPLPVAPPPTDPTARPGPTKDGFLLPNGWHVTPAGKHVPTTDLPLNIVPLKDGRHVLVGTCGFNPHHLSLIDLVDGKVVSQETVIQSWFGLAVAPDEQRVWWSGGGANGLDVSDLAVRTLSGIGPPEPDPAAGERRRGGADRPVGFASGVCLAADGKGLYALDIEASTVTPVATDGTRGQPGP